MYEKIVLFEDDVARSTRIAQDLLEALSGRGTAVRFDLDVKPETAGMYQDQIEKVLASPPYENATLILADYDLSESRGYPGLSEQQVKAAASRLAIPECGYARGMTPSSVEFKRLSKQRETQIVLDFSPGQEAELVRRAVCVADGFAFMIERLPRAIAELKRASPGALMARLLGKLEYADKIALYASGDQDRLVDMKKLTKDESSESYHSRLACALGYWLWDSLLRYPGVLVNCVAAASYLNISDEHFRIPDVQELFAGAKYDGPFSERDHPQWWRGMLYDLVANGRFSDGRELASEHLGRAVDRSSCCEEPGIPAGYYCMLSEKPVSLKNSRGGLPWFPRGADLARVSKSKYDELVPWL